MASTNDNESFVPEGMPQDHPFHSPEPSIVPIPEQIIRVIIAEFRNGGDLNALAAKYGVTPGAIALWDHERNGTTASSGVIQSETVPDGNGEKLQPRSTGRYSRDLKQEVVGQLLDGRTAADVSQQYGICDATLYRWKKEAKKAGGIVPEAKSTKPPTNASPINEEHRALVLKIKKENPNMGPAQIQNRMRRFHAIKISRHMIGRIFAEAGIPLEKRVGAKEKNDPADNGFEMSRPNELWAVDFKEFWIHSEKAYGLFILDDFSRFCVGYALTQKATADLAIETVNASIQRYGRPERILSDRGAQFHAWNGVSKFSLFLDTFLTDHTVTKADHPFTNGKIEAFNKTLDNELLLVEELSSLEAAEVRIPEFLRKYNFLRTHTGINDLVPADRYFGMVEEAQQALTAGLAKAGPGLTWLRQLVSQDGPGLRPPTLLQLVVNDGKLEIVALGRRFQLG